MIWSYVMPPHYDGGGVTVRHHFSMTSATSGTMNCQGAFERIGVGQQDIDSDGFAAANTRTSKSVPGTSGHVATAQIKFTDGADMDSVTSGEEFRYRFQRTMPGGAAGDLELHFVVGEET